MEKLVSSIGGNIYQCKPVLVERKEDSVVLVASGSTVCIIAASTGELIGRFGAHHGSVSCIAVRSIGDSFQVVSGSVNGQVIRWSLETQEVLSEFTLNYPILSLGLPHSIVNGAFFGNSSVESSAVDNKHSEDEIFLVLANNNDDIGAEENSKANADYKFRLVVFDTKAMKTRRRLSEVSCPRQCFAVWRITTGNSVEEYVVVGERRTLTVWSVDDKSVVCQFPCEVPDVITCLDVNHETGLIVTGHGNGEIAVWQGVPACLHSKSLANLSPRVSRLHWHAHAVSSVGISENGAQIFSGGEEGVLVCWQVGQLGEKSFLPRLGAAVRFVSSGCVKEAASVLVAGADNTIRIVNAANMKIMWTYRALYIPSKQQPGRRRDILCGDEEEIYHADPCFRSSIRVEPRTGYIACSGSPGELQMFDVGHSRYCYSHEVLQYTRVSRRELDVKMWAPSVTFFRFFDSSAGSFLATIDVRRGEGTDMESCLKFWLWEPSQDRYRLTAQVDRPHGSNRVTGLEFFRATPDSACRCATAAVDGCVKIWAARFGKTSSVHGSSQGSVTLSWSCSCSFKWRDGPVHSLAFSFDGSLLVIAQANLISLWDTNSIALKTSFVAPSNNVVNFLKLVEPCAHPSLGGGNGQALLVLGSKREVSVYDLLAGKVLWTRKGRVCAIDVADDFSALKFREELPKGWIAVCMSETGKKAMDDSDSDSEEPTKEAASSNKYTLLVMNVLQSDPLYCMALDFKATSMVFWSGKPFNLSNRILFVSASGELFQLADKSVEAPHKTAGFATALRQDRSAGLALEPPTLATKVGSIGLSAGAVKVSDLLGGRSDSMPTLAALYGSYMSKLLRRAPGNNDATTDRPPVAQTQPEDRQEEQQIDVSRNREAEQEFDFDLNDSTEFEAAFEAAFLQSVKTAAVAGQKKSVVEVVEADGGERRSRKKAKAK